jgi:putative ABC transport system ATP-binding protein
MSTSLCIDLEHISLSLQSPAGKINILHDISLQVPAAETVSIIGPSGAGKTSLLMVMSGLEAVTSGTVRIDGEDITRYSEDALARFRRQHIGIVFQNFHLIPTMSALENVAVPLELAGADDAFERAAAMLGQVGLAARITHFPAQLSGGEQQRVALARAFVTRPKLLLADEPTGNLDHHNGELITELMFSLRDQFGTTLLLITHDRELAGRCNRQLVISDGMLR